MKIRENKMRIFLSSLVGTALIIALLCGFIIVEKNTRYIAFGDDSRFFICERKKILPSFLKIHFMGKDYIYSKENM